MRALEIDDGPETLFRENSCVLPGYEPVGKNNVAARAAAY
jgi:hypothetical protein